MINNRFRGIISATVLCLMMSCAHHHEEAHEEAEEHEHHDHHEHDADEIVMSADDAKRFGVEVEVAEKKDFVESLKVVGEIMPSSTDVTVVSAPTSGIITFARCTELGEKVSKGHQIASISSEGVSGGNVDMNSKAALESAKRELDRLKPLLDEKLITLKEYNDALAAYENAKTLYSPVALRGKAVAASGGIISNLAVGDGAYVETGQTIATISGDSRLTLKALLPAKDAAFLPKISSANIVPSHGEEVIELSSRGGKLLSSSLASGSNIPGYISVFFSFDNKGDLVPGAIAEVYLTGQNRSDAITLPISAISEQQGQKFVYVRDEEHAYKKQNVTTGRSDGKRIEVLSGIEEGDTVVTAGTTFIRLAETSTVVPEGHSHHH